MNDLNLVADAANSEKVMRLVVGKTDAAMRGRPASNIAIVPASVVPTYRATPLRASLNSAPKQPAVKESIDAHATSAKALG